MSGEENRRRIKLETRHGGSRESRSRKDRPCDTCRTRKSACVIAVKPPCRFCEIRGLECTFDTGPRPRHRKNNSSIDSIGTANLDNHHSESDTEIPLSSNDHASPQASRFPVPLNYPPVSTISSLSDPSLASERSFMAPTRQYLSLQDLTSNPDDSLLIKSSGAVHRRPPLPTKPRELSSQESERARHSLEYGKDTTAHFIGLSGEQDTDLFSSIRYNVLNETKFIDFNVHQVFVGNATAGKPPIHFSILNNTFTNRDQIAKKAASDAIELHIGSHGEALVRLYFRFVHPMCPVISKAGFVMAYAADRLSIPASLRGCIYGLACAFWTQDPSLKGLPPISQPELFEHAHAALNRELDSPKLATLQACLLILHEQPDLSGTTESPRIWVLACQATACAQSLGLHQDPTEWKLPQWEKKLRKRLWWVVIIHDVWTSICHGNTPHIVPGSFDTTELTMEDIASDEYVMGLQGSHILEEQDRTAQVHSATRLLDIIKVTKVLWGVIKDTFTLESYSQIIRKEKVIEREVVLLDYKFQINQIASSLSEEMNLASPLVMKFNGFFYIGVFAVKFLILRQLMAPAIPESKSDPTSNLCRHFDLALSEGEAFVQFAAKIFTLDLRVFHPRHSRNNLIICVDHLIYLFFCASTESHVSKAYEMLQRYQEILKKCAKDADWSTVGLIRPSLLRADSFFQGAADSIRLGARS